MTEAGWTAEVPKEIGVYWWRSNAADNHPWIVRVHKGWLGLMLMQTMGGPLVTIGDGGEWLGPLSPTDRQQGRVAGLRECKHGLDIALDEGPLKAALYRWIDARAERLEREAQAAQAAQDEKGGRDGK